MQQSGNIRMGITNAQSDTKQSHNMKIGMGITGANITAGMMPLNRTIKPPPPIMMASTMKGRRSTIGGNETVTAKQS